MAAIIGGPHLQYVDIVGALSQTSDPSRYWPDLKRQIVKESGSSELLEGIEQLKMPGKDGKMYPTPPNLRKFRVWPIRRRIHRRTK